MARRLGIDTALTFTETDIVVASTINQLLGKTWARPEADMIARDKRQQREFLAAHSIPSVRYIPVSRASNPAAAAERLGYPLIFPGGKLFRWPGGHVRASRGISAWP